MNTTLDITSSEALRTDIHQQYPFFSEAESVLSRVNSWISRGDNVLVYENRDLGHPHIGDHIYVSYGGVNAQIERSQFPEPPQSLPDIGGIIGWRYQLVGVVSGDG